jgi:hypothetical protein
MNNEKLVTDMGYRGRRQTKNPSLLQTTGGKDEPNIVFNESGTNVYKNPAISLV